MSNKVKIPCGGFVLGEGLALGEDGKTLNVTGGGSQADWNQNDETAADFVKNRPFYTGDPVLVEESTVEFVEGSGLYQAEFPSPTIDVTIGEVYTVTWDGTAYECTCVDNNSDLAIGNLSIIGDGDDTGEPFLMLVFNGQGIVIITADTSASHTFSISATVAPVVKIDEKYLPDTLATKLYVNEKISDTEIFLKSSTANSTKKFKITVDDSGTISATEVTA